MDGESTENQKTHIKVALVSKHRTKTHITPEFLLKGIGNVWMATLKDMIKNKVELPNMPVACFSHIPYNGAVVIKCENELTAEIVRKAFAGKVIEGIELDVIDANNLPKPVKMAWKTRSHHRKNNTAALQELQKAHPSLRTYEWRILSCNEEIHYIRWVVHMAPDSAKVIEKAGYRLSYKPSNGKIIVDTFKPVFKVNRFKNADADLPGPSGESQIEAEGDRVASNEVPLSDDEEQEESSKEKEKPDENKTRKKQNKINKAKKRKTKNVAF